MDSNNNQKNKQHYLNSISKFCDKCGTAYTKNDVNVIKDTGSTAIIHLTCHNCKSKNIATVHSKTGSGTRMPINTDLKVNEINKFAKKSEISSQELLDLYVYMKENKEVSI